MASGLGKHESANCSRLGHRSYASGFLEMFPLDGFLGHVPHPRSHHNGQDDKDGALDIPFLLAGAMIRTTASHGIVSLKHSFFRYALAHNLPDNLLQCNTKEEKALAFCKVLAQLSYCNLQCSAMFIVNGYEESPWHSSS